MANIALVTDFGIREWYVGVMKAVIQDVYPGCSVIDISHHVHAQNVREAGFVLWNAYSYFPQGTIFTTVVDPGVGSDRAILAVETDDHWFVAPDNGILDFVLAENNVRQAHQISNPDYYRTSVSNTFHGRDIFAPVSAHLARGVTVDQLGTPVELPYPASPFKTVNNSNDNEGEVLYIDQFGNLITNLALDQGISGKTIIRGQTISNFVNAYAEANEGQLLAIRGSSGLLEISVRNSSAAGNLNAEIGEKLVFNAH